jgi:hypothetical protein
VRRVCALLFLSLLAIGPLLNSPGWISASALAARQSEAGIVGYRGDAARTGNQPGPGPTAAPTERWRFVVPFDQNDPNAELLADFLVLSWPVVAEGVVYAGGLDGALYAIGAGSGAQRWRLETGAIGSVAAPVVADGVVFAGAQDGLLLAVDAASGEERWRVELGPGSVANLPLKAAAGGFRNGLVAHKARQTARAAPAQTAESSKATADAPSEIRPVLVSPMTPASPSSTAPIARSENAKPARVPRVP